jgi:hypothetical protein
MLVKKALITVGVLMVFCVAVTVAGFTIEPKSAIAPITTESACPATGCASGSCHGFDNVPEPDGVSEMVCPEAGCASVECHAWDTLTNRYHQASDASLNVWILMPVILVIGLVVLVKAFSRKEGE